MSLQDDIFDIRDALKGKPAMAAAFARVESRLVELENVGGSRVVAMVLSGDPYDEREGPWFSQADLGRLRSLPPGTKLFAAA